MSPDGRELVIATGNPHKVEELSAILASDLAALGIRLLGLRDLEARGLGPFHEPDEGGATFEENASIKAISYARQTGTPCVADDSGLEIDALGGRPGVISSHYFNDGQADGHAAGMGRGERDRRNIRRVLDELRAVPIERRSARFVCVMAMASPHPAGGSGLQSSTTPPQSEPRTSDTAFQRHEQSPSDPPGGGATVGAEAPRHLADATPSAPVRLFRGVLEGVIGLPADDCPPDRPDLLIPRGEHGFGYDPIFLVAPDHARTSAELGPAAKNAISHRARAAAMLSAWLRSQPPTPW